MVHVVIALTLSNPGYSQLLLLLLLLYLRCAVSVIGLVAVDSAHE
jgi:hypothetical protein